MHISQNYEFIINISKSSFTKAKSHHILIAVMLQVVTPEKTKAKRCPPPTLCELTIDTRTTGAQLSKPVSKDELRCAYAIVKRLLHQNKGDVHPLFHNQTDEIV